MSENKEIHITSIGGQAVIEGVMMRGPLEAAVAVRKPNNEIVVDKKKVGSITQKLKFLKLPIFRGIVSFFESMILAMKALTYSAEFFDLEEQEPSKFDKWIEEKLGNKLQGVMIFISMVIAIAFSVFLFVLVPNLGAKLMFQNDRLMYNLSEGIIRIGIFIGYIWLISRLKDIQRVFEYHGAEHKSIHCYEHGEELTVENVKKYTRLHPRCGTSFLLIVMVISILIFSFVWSDVFMMNVLYRILLLPLVAGISYEIIKIGGRSQNKCITWINAPGLWFQTFTTKEPDDSQIEVAIVALKSVLVEDKELDRW